MAGRGIAGQHLCRLDRLVDWGFFMEAGTREMRTEKMKARKMMVRMMRIRKV